MKKGSTSKMKRRAEGDASSAPSSPPTEAHNGKSQFANFRGLTNQLVVNAVASRARLTCADRASFVFQFTMVMTF
jgi:hypothetical protein